LTTLAVDAEGAKDLDGYPPAQAVGKEGTSYGIPGAVLNVFDAELPQTQASGAEFPHCISGRKLLSHFLHDPQKDDEGVTKG